MRLDERDDFVDLVAQAVIDRLEERDRIEGMVSIVVSRVIALQKKDAETQQASSEATDDTAPEPTDSPDDEGETDGN